MGELDRGLDVVSPREVRVLVTAFGPFAQHTTNPSSSILALLPDTLTLTLPTPPSPPPSSRSSPDSPAIDADPSRTRTERISIRLLRQPPLPVSYHHTATTLPPLLSSLTPDLVLHMGVASGRTHFAAERSAPNGPFPHPDIHGLTPSSTPLLRGGSQTLEGKDADMPARLETSLPYDELYTRWAGRCQAEVEGWEEGLVRPSDAVGNYLCAYSFFTSLAWLKREGREGAVLFLHVPECEGEREVKRGAELARRLVECMVEVWLDGRSRS